MKSQYQINEIKENLEITAMSLLRDGDDYAYVSSMLHNANKANEYGIQSVEIEKIVSEASKQVFN